jgi:hypothetical protein
MNDLHRYYEHRSELDTADLLTYVTDGAVSWAIRQWSPGANHAGMVLYLREYAGETERRWTMEATAHGPRMAFLSELLEELDGECYWHQLKPEISNAKREAAGGWALTQQGVVKYDLKGVLQYPFRKVSANLNKLACSEYVQFSWWKGTIITMEVGAIMARPSDLPNFGVTRPPILLVTHKPFIQVPSQLETITP